MLDERKLNILHAIINSYILSGEPIGSSTISKQYEFGLSSATIRNEMSDLEYLGYLIKPHTSAGRVPSDKAYKLYVNYILDGEIANNRNEKYKENIKKALYIDSNEILSIIENASKILSAFTNYTSLAITPQTKESKLKHFQIIDIGDNNLLVVLISDSDSIRNLVLRSQTKISADDLLIVQNFINKEFKGLTKNEIIALVESDRYKELQKFKGVFSQMIPVIIDILSEIEEIEVFTEGITNILNYPEYKDVEKARNFISFLEDKDILVEMLLANSIDESGIQSKIGCENHYDELKSCSLITTTYTMGDMTIGKIGVIGPTRMEYGRVIRTLQEFSLNITEILNKIVGKDRGD